MKFFSGFSLKGEEEIFKEYLPKGDFVVAGFSKGAIEAFEYVYRSEDRVDRLLLFSPAFFQDRDEKFKRVQLIHFGKNSASYVENFLKSVSYPSRIDMKKYLSLGDYEELKRLLYYEWKKEKIESVVERGVRIEVFLGEKDKIINAFNVREFFKRLVTTYYIKGVGHILKGE